MTVIQAKNTKERVESMGIFFEKQGLTPMTGRVFAYLLLSDPPYQDFYTIQDFLQASKSAISNALKYLLNLGTVDYITFSGDRKRYFRVNADIWLDYMKNRIHNLEELSELVTSVLNERSGEYQEFNDKLQRIVDFQTYLATGVRQLIKDWEEKV